MSDPSLKTCNLFLIFLPQSPDKMAEGRKLLGLSKEKKTGQRTLSREEFEINQALSSPASGSRTNDQTEKNKTPPAALPRHQTPISMGDLSSLIRDTVVQGVKEGVKEGLASEISKSILGKRNRHSSQSSQVDSDLPDCGVDPVHKGTVPPVEVFGSDINYEPSSDCSDADLELDESYNNPFLIRNPSPSVLNPEASVLRSEVDKTSASEVVDEPDVDLPSANSRLPASWFPKKKTLLWLNKVANKEWSADDRKKLTDKYHPPEEYDHLLSPVKMPKKLYQAIKSPSIKKKDFLFNRSAAEKELFYASTDLCTSLRPLIEAISLLDDKPGCSDIKHIIGQGIIGIFSANIRISRGRREISRKCVKLDCAEALFRVAPTHNSLFGNSSDSEAVKAAKELTKSDETFVYKPSYKKPYRSPYNQGFLYQPQDQFKSGKNQFFQKPYYDYQFKSSEKNQSQGQKSRGRGQRGRGQKNPSKPAYSKE